MHWNERLRSSQCWQTANGHTKVHCNWRGEALHGIGWDRSSLSIAFSTACCFRPNWCLLRDVFAIRVCYAISKHIIVCYAISKHIIRDRVCYAIRGFAQLRTGIFCSLLSNARGTHMVFCSCLSVATIILQQICRQHSYKRFSGHSICRKNVWKISAHADWSTPAPMRNGALMCTPGVPF